MGEDRTFTTNPETCPTHGNRLVGGSCPVDGCDYELDE